MKTLIRRTQKVIRESYVNHFMDKNWGLWNIEKMPDVGIGFKLLQYVNDNGNICDVIKFDEPVLLEGLRRSHTTFHFKFKPNHNSIAWPTFNDGRLILRTCQDCGKKFPVGSDHWASSRKCVKCAEQKPFRFKNWLTDQRKYGQMSFEWAKKMGKYTFGIKDENLIESLYDETFNK